MVVTNWAEVTTASPDMLTEAPQSVRLLIPAIAASKCGGFI